MKGERPIGNLRRFFNKNIAKKCLPPLLIVLVVAALITVVFLKRKVITIVIDGQPKKYFTFKDTLDSALQSKKIALAPKDKIEPSIESKIFHKETITIKRAVGVNIKVDGQDLSVQSAEENIDLLLKAEGIRLNTVDKINPQIDTKLSEGLKVEIVRVETKTYTDKSPVDFKTIIRYDRDIANTSRRTVQDGQLGEKQTTTDVVYEDNVEVKRTVTSEAVVKEPTDKIIVQGTYPVKPISRGGEPVPYGQVLKVRATAYSAIRGVGKTYTASGRKAVRDPDGYSTIAVDPSVIPLGTKLFVENYGFAIAADTGTAILGNTIDVFFDTYRESCDWAVKYVTVYILK